MIFIYFSDYINKTLICEIQAETLSQADDICKNMGHIPQKLMVTTQNWSPKLSFAK